jgi:Flp pilus assembly pilin Flp
MRWTEKPGLWRATLYARCSRSFGNAITAATLALRDAWGQDLIEYALVAALIARGATVSMKGVATAISTAFNNMAGHVSTYTS